MKQTECLEQLYNGNITAQEAYSTLVPTFDTRSLKKARYVRFKIFLPEESKRLNLFLRLLFSLPLPMFLARFGLKIVGKNMAKGMESKGKEFGNFNVTPEEFMELIKYSRGTKITIESKDAIIKIRVR